MKYLSEKGDFPLTYKMLYDLSLAVSHGNNCLKIETNVQASVAAPLAENLHINTGLPKVLRKHRIQLKYCTTTTTISIKPCTHARM